MPVDGNKNALISPGTISANNLANLVLKYTFVDEKKKDVCH
jgi:hypothetical protein